MSQKQTASSVSALSPDDVAIIGMAAHLPGARNVREYWKNLLDGKESVKAFSEDELLEAGVAREVLSRPNYVRSGVVLENLEWFDAEFFGFSPKEAAIMDPQHRHFLECAWEALEDAAHPPESFEGTIGVYAGCGMGSYFIFNLLTNRALVDQVGLFLLRHTGNDKDFLATRASYCFDLKGPSINVQTACSTSLVAVHQAVQSLLSGECDMALAGGVTIELPHHRGYLFHEGEILSPDGHCRAFDHRSQGTIFGSGAGVVVLRRAEDAVRDGDHIYAIVKGSAINNDGAGKMGYLAPSVDGQAKAVIEALSVAGVSADTIDYVEAHGTGTAMGDPIEISALTQAFRDSTKRTGFCGIGSVKTNIGHLDTAAGVASLIKVSMALAHGELPPTLNYEKQNPAIAFEKTPFVVQAARTAWPTSAKKPRRAGVNSLGVGGTNAHVILEEAPHAATAGGGSPQSFELVTLSARSKKALEQSSRELATALRENPSASLADVAYTLRVGRRAFHHRRVLACASVIEAAELLESNDARRVYTHAADGKRESIAFLFPGGGAQYARMGRGLFEQHEVFKRSVERGLQAFERRTKKDLARVLFPSDAELSNASRELERPSLQLPAIFIVECALAELWKSFGVTPAALIGHSLGENTAACVGGVMSYEDALGLVTLRGELFERVPPGGMLSVALAADELEPLLGADLELAVVNAPKLCVASGPYEALDRLAAQLAEREIEARRIPIAIAAHSRMLEPILAEFGAYLARIELSAPKIPIVSNRTGTWLTNAQARDPKYWVEHLRHTIRFADGIGTLLQDAHRVLLECGPGKVLSSLAKQHPQLSTTHNVIPSLRHPDEVVDDGAFFLASAGRLWASGIDVDVAHARKSETRRRVSLPTYPFQRQRYWIEPGKFAHDAASADEERPKRLADFDAWFSEPVWKRAPLAEPVEAAPQTWLVFADEAGDDANGLGDGLVERLRARGHEVLCVREADAYEKTSEQTFSLSPEHGRGGYDALVKDLVAAGKLPQRIVHLWMVTEEETFRPGSSFFHRNQERGFYSLFFLAQALGDEGIATPLHIDVVSNGMQRVHGEPLPYPEKATLLGPCRVIPRELANVTCTSIDVERAIGDRKQKRGGRARAKKVAQPSALDLLERELLAPRGDATVAHRGGERFVLAWERARLAADSGKYGVLSAVRESGVYLITGGLGGMGLAIGEHLARTAQAKLAFVSRSSFPDRAAWDAWLTSHTSDDATSRRIAKLLEIERAGGEVFLASADVTDVEEMRGAVAAVRARFGALHGLIHAAGVLHDDPLQAKTQAGVEDVFTPKVHGTLVLDELFRAGARSSVDSHASHRAHAPRATTRDRGDDDELELFVLCSSTSALIGPAGQIDYAAANAFLDAYAQSRADDPSTRVVALDWGVWREVGMAAEAARKKTGAVAPQRTPIEHPIFDAVLDDSANATFVASLSARSGARAHWILDEHRTKAGQAVWPGTGYLELARAALAAHGEARPFAIEDLFFLRPLHVPDGDAKETRVRLSRDDEGYGFQVQSALITDGGRAALETHAQARLLLHDLPLAGSLDLAAIEARCTRVVEALPGGSIATGQEAHLAFGPRWHVLRKIAWGAGEALARLSLDARFESELDAFGLHPALLDLATGYAMELIAGYSSTDGLWVPVSYKRVCVHGPLPREIASFVRMSAENSAPGFALFDVVIADTRGKILVEIEGFAIKRMQAGADFALASKPSERELEFLPPEHDASTRSLSPAEASFQHNLEQGILPAEGARALERVLAAAPRPQVAVSSLDLGLLIAEQDRARPTTRDASDTFARPELENEYVEPRDGIERALVGYWQELLGVDKVGIRDSFFDLGGHSLIAVRLFAKIKKAYQVEYPISILFEAPTIERCADRIRESTGASLAGADGADAHGAKKEVHRTRYVHLVPMHAKEARNERLPFFLVAGMFGNVLNLRHLANLVGADRAIYGLQARGLYGDHAPHETFEEMASDYLKELATVQPRGPYLLGGFSGGGITAYEMAQQLLARGEEVLLLVLLDTPLPHAEPLSTQEKMLIHLQRVKKKGATYFTEWAKSRVQWELGRIRKRRAGPRERRAGEYHSETIEQAFRRALERYDLRRYPGRVTLFRPKLDLSHPLGAGRIANVHRELVYPDNGWTPHVGDLVVNEVPGDHDGMVLEPNVRVLATRLRRAIERAEAERRVPRSRAS